MQQPLEDSGGLQAKEKHQTPKESHPEKTESSVAGQRKIRVNLSGKRFGRLIAISIHKVDAHGNSSWLCKCDCGVETIVRMPNLRSGNTRSCGCLSREMPRPHLVGVRTHGLCHSSEYTTWGCMLQRCLNPNHDSYEDYGGRGIEVCGQWKKFENFYADMGPRPEGKTLDRFPNKNGNYEPGNCRWADGFEQMNNTRRNRFVEHNGENLTISQWARKIGVHKNSIADKLNRGWPIHLALTKPNGKKKLATLMKLEAQGKWTERKQ